jgi:hypothetical protein
VTRRAGRPCIVFEIRKYLAGRWELDSIFNDRDTAVEEANELMDRRTSLLGVCVVAVTEDGEKFKEWTVFKRDKGQTKPATRCRPAVRPAAPVKLAGDSRELYGSREVPPDRSSGCSGLIFCAQMTFGIAAVLGTAVLGVYLLTTIL